MNLVKWFIPWSVYSQRGNLKFRGTAIQFVKYNLSQAWIPSSVLIDEQKMVLNPCNLFQKN